ncbi:MAG: nucleotide sugar dehydrogenase [Candidatus Eremiobacteraeota bacterium]|nr:nucleotide sugar dehydrogenase [Candidatus Eremiobacteraeota bacterium]
MELLKPSPANDERADLVAKIETHSATVGVVGIGYVGLPLAVEKAKVGFPVVGFDRNPLRVNQVAQGLNYIRDVDDDELAAVVYNGRLSATTDFSRLGTCDVIVICVPTPLTKNLDPDISYIKHVGEAIAGQLRPGQLICLESTTYPGTTEEVLLPLLAATGLVVGRDYFLAFSPERVDPGNKRYTTRNTNKVVGGVTPVCLDVAAAFYQQTIFDVLRVSSPRVAEMTKVFENTFRAVNIALVNEMALLCDRLKVNIWDVIDAAATKPFGIMRFDPGPGVGGHCIPLDPFYLAWKAREFDFHVRFIELAGEINIAMPYFVRDKILRALNEQGKPLKDARILAIGVAYKKDIEDWRESPAVKVLDLLEREGARVDYHDPFVPSFQEDDGKLRHSVPLTKDVLKGSDCVVVLTDHTTIDWQTIVDHAVAVVDTRNATRAVRDGRDNVVLL